MSALAFELPARLEAHEPPEARGLRRDGVRLLVATRHDSRIVHSRFAELPSFLEPGDLRSLTHPSAGEHFGDGSPFSVVEVGTRKRNLSHL